MTKKINTGMSGLIQSKGQAKPAVIEAEKESTVIAKRTTAAGGVQKALTVKLDHARYCQLKAVGASQGKKSQEIFVEALDAWLLKNQ